MSLSWGRHFSHTFRRGNRGSVSCPARLTPKLALCCTPVSSSCLADWAPQRGRWGTRPAAQAGEPGGCPQECPALPAPQPGSRSSVVSAPRACYLPPSPTPASSCLKFRLWAFPLGAASCLFCVSDPPALRLALRVTQARPQPCPLYLPAPGTAGHSGGRGCQGPIAFSLAVGSGAPQPCPGPPSPCTVLLCWPPPGVPRPS